jgi:hypothetical protein
MQYLKRLILYFPLLLITTYSLSIMVISKEIIYFSELTNHKDDYIVGLALSNYTPEYKYVLSLSHKPEVLIVGTSRVMQFELSDYIQSEIYNAGGAIQRLTDIPVLVDNLIDNGYYPNKIIIGLDQNFFNPNWAENSEYEKNRFEQRLTNLPDLVVPNRLEFFRILLTNPYDLSKVLLYQGDNLGINAIVKQEGFNKNGFYNYGNGLFNDKRFDDTRWRIDNNASGFQRSDEYSYLAIQIYEEFLEVAKINNIEIIAFLPPYSPTIYEHMLVDGGYGYIDKLSLTLDTIHLKYGYEFHDFTLIENFNDDFYIDGFHGNSAVYDYIFDIILKS